MIGLLIGALATLVIAQVFAFSEGQRRTTTNGMDAQVNGALALYTVQRDVRHAGYGMAINVNALGCEIRAQYDNVDYTWSLAPIVITFLAVAGEPIESLSTTPLLLASTPELPAEKVIVMSRLFQMNWSVVALLAL